MTTDATDPTCRPPASSRSIHILLGIVLLLGFLFRLNELGQLSVKDLDESFHAIVARSMMRDPLRPMLYAQPFLPYDPNNWLANHVWLHKPPLALWQMAGSMAFFGESNFSMRLPSLLLSTASVLLTFLIGRSLGDARAGLVAAAFQSFCPAITQLVHGQVFSDHVDTALLFYCELSVWMLIRAGQSGSLKQASIAGALMGAGWLTKSFPATFVFGLAGLLWLLGRRPRSAICFHISARQFAYFAAWAVGVCIPWVAWAFYAFPREYWYEQVHVFRHLTEGIETFGHPWDRLLFDYLLRVLLEWYPLVAVAFGLLVVDAIRRREIPRLFVLLWAVGVFVPHLLATSKTPSATLIGWPALWLAAGYCVSDALRGRAVALGILLVGGLALLRPYPTFSSLEKKDVTHFAAIMLFQWRLLVEIGVVALGAAIAYSIRSRVSRAPRRVFITALALVFAFPIARHVILSYRTGDAAPREPVAFPKLGRLVRANSPPNAVFFVENLSRNEHLIAMWWLDRSCYPLIGEEFGAQVNDVLERGGVPFILSRGPRPEPALISIPDEATVYRLDQAKPTGDATP